MPSILGPGRSAICGPTPSACCVGLRILSNQISREVRRFTFRKVLITSKINKDKMRGGKSKKIRFMIRLGFEPRRIAPPGMGVKVDLNLAP